MPRKTANAAPANDFSFDTVMAAAPAKKGKKERVRVECGEIVQQIAAIKVMQAMLTVAETDLKDTLKTGAMTDYYVAEGMKIKGQPENVDGVHGLHVASMQLRKRASNQPLNTEEAELCGEFDIPTQTLPPALQFNPDYMPGGKKFDADLLIRLQAAIRSVEGLPADIIQPSGTTKVVTTDASIPAIFKLGENAVRRLLPVVSVLSVGGKYNLVNDDVTPALEDVGKVLALPRLREKLTEAAKNPSKYSGWQNKEAA